MPLPLSCSHQKQECLVGTLHSPVLNLWMFTSPLLSQKSMPTAGRESTGRKDQHHLGPEVCISKAAAFFVMPFCTFLFEFVCLFAGLDVQEASLFH